MVSHDVLLIEGYAAVFGLPDASGDVVRAGAFARSLRGGAHPPMLLMHRSGAIAGRWTRIIEDGRGLYLRGLVEAGSARALVGQGLNGLSIGFRPRLWRPRVERGRELIDLELVEVSLVSAPMQGRARFVVLGNEIAKERA
jgi:HK97 family phage prohead protease